MLGVHLEGPFISPARPGIHRADHIAVPQLSDLDWLADLAGAMAEARAAAMPDPRQVALKRVIAEIRARALSAGAKPAAG